MNADPRRRTDGCRLRRRADHRALPRRGAARPRLLGRGFGVGEGVRLIDRRVCHAQCRNRQQAPGDVGVGPTADDVTVHTILPDQLYDYLTTGASLPSKPVMLTFDDTDDDQFSIAGPEMKKYGYKGVFFIMTVSLNRPRYMTKDQVKQLAEEGHVINSHTWDHHSVKGYKTPQDWATQIEKPKKQIEEIIGKTTLDFAYPFGLWNREAIPELKKRSIRSAYILSTKRDPDDPLYTIRRIIASGYWSANTLARSMRESFK